MRSKVHLILLCCLISHFAIAEIQLFFPSGAISHIAKISFHKANSNQFGYFELFKEANGKVFFQVLFSNGSRTEAQLGALVACIQNDKVVEIFNVSRKLGWSIHGSVERAVQLDLSSCPENSFPAIQWNNHVNSFLDQSELNSVINEREDFFRYPKTIGEIYNL